MRDLYKSTEKPTKTLETNRFQQCHDLFNKIKTQAAEKKAQAQILLSKAKIEASQN